MGASIITGYTGTRHITPEMDGAVYRGIIGDDSYILAEGDQCEGSMPSVNQFTVKSGVVSIQGRQIYITQETLAVDTCPTGYKRIDLVCARFEHDTTSLVDQASLIVIKGAEVSGGNDPVEPAHNEGVIKDGATVVDFVMYRLDLDGANVEITKAATVQSSLYMSKETQEKWNDIAGGASNDAIMDYIADNMTLKTGVMHPGSGTNANEIQIKQIGPLVMVKGYFQKSSGTFPTGSNFNIATFDGVDYPKSNIRTVCGAGQYAYSATDSGYMNIGTNGTITVQLATARQCITFCVVYIVAD